MLSAEVLKALGDPNTDADFEDLLLRLAQAVAQAAAKLVQDARSVAGNTEGELQDDIIDAAKQTALTTQQLMACTKVLSPHMNNPLCQQQMVEAARLVDSSIDGVERTCYVSLFEQDFVGGGGGTRYL